MAGAALALPLRAAEARPDPDPTFPAFDRHDCNTGFLQDPRWTDDGLVTDPIHHSVEPLLAPLLPASTDVHYDVTCTIAGATLPLLGVGL